MPARIKLSGIPALYAQILHAGLPEPAMEYRFLSGRRFAFDLAWPEYRVAAEQDGGIFGKGKPCPLCKRKPPAGHSSVERLLSDMEKLNLAALGGWLVVRFLPSQVETGSALGLVEQALRARGYEP